MLKLDHITVVARTLEEGCKHIKDTLGIDMPDGGAHPRMGTHNRLLSLGDDSFLELIAIDPAASAPDRPRWFNLDAFDKAPRLGTWVLGTDDIQASLREAHPGSGRATEITRGDLKWLISISDDGTMPLDGACPALIQWPVGPHPASRMTDLGCRLISLTIEHPQVAELESLFGHHINRDLITFRRGPEMKISAVIQTPEGMRELT
ncbi:VOC family protein [Actibacterium sp. XHP0104]|uniref:VOC family protein n=1 Tax=Actibacterium sp. XHP0104 TaxID=2984335 RepID=UPI0021E84F9D|nr:VOC family protein [Actibacterium sp. XHP0104]MCV2880939.1 VOC family protein [Actibacterium sp. XHP0104]